MYAFKFKTNINCGNCIRSVTPFLNELDEVESWRVDTDNPEKILLVEMDVDNPSLVQKAVSDAGFTAELMSA